MICVFIKGDIHLHKKQKWEKRIFCRCFCLRLFNSLPSIKPNITLPQHQGGEIAGSSSSLRGSSAPLQPGWADPLTPHQADAPGWQGHVINDIMQRCESTNSKVELLRFTNSVKHRRLLEHGTTCPPWSRSVMCVMWNKNKLNLLYLFIGAVGLVLFQS